MCQGSHVAVTMNTSSSSYLFMSKRKRVNVLSQKMEKHSSSGSNLSLDSLEADFKEKIKVRDEVSPDVDTILVPFYQKDVLIKIPKGQSKKQKKETTKSKKEIQNSNSYLVNKDRENKKKRASYLEMFRKQFTSHNEKNEKNNYKYQRELRSLSPEFGDTERESFGEELNNPTTEFYNTECYNEMFYDKLIHQELDQYLDNSFREELQLDELGNKSPEDTAYNLKSVSEVSHSRRHVRRATVEPIQNVKLGGLGPDVEKIKPRLERARSLQRYSEKVRMENRVKIYKRSVQADIEKKAERNPSAKATHSARKNSKGDDNISYLVNKSADKKTAQIYVPRSAGVMKSRDKSVTRKDKGQEIKSRSASRNIEHEKDRQKSAYQERRSHRPHDSAKIKTKIVDNDANVRVKSSARSKAINTQTVNTVVPPVQISFLVNVGGARPSSALRRLEEKHQMYKERVKAYSTENNE